MPIKVICNFGCLTTSIKTDLKLYHHYMNIFSLACKEFLQEKDMDDLCILGERVPYAKLNLQSL